MMSLVMRSNLEKKSNEPDATSVPAPENAHLTTESPAGELALGHWYWVKCVATWDDKENGRKTGDEYEWFGCAMRIGSNYVEVRSPGGSYTRVHLDNYWEVLRREEHPETVISARLEHWRSRANELVAEIHALTRRLGVAKSHTLNGPTAATGAATSSSLLALSGQANLHAYKAELTFAKEKTLPALHADLKKATEKHSTWVKASMLSLEASITPMRDTITTIDDRLFSFGLYAGLAESAARCCDGSPAAHDEPLHVMQRRLYMDEEALLSYEAGGMDFTGIAEFDDWLCRPQNRDRILPFPRTLVAMRVRRSPKERETHGDLLATFIKIKEEHADQWTFIYVRNGDQVWRITCEIDFGPMIFPDGSIYSEGEPMMVRMFANSVDKLITRAEFEQHLAAYRDLKAKSKAWRRANPDEDTFHDPYLRSISGSVSLPNFGDFRPGDWEPFDRSNVHFDDIKETVDAKIKEYNRVAVIIQGLFDRSEVLHPHPPVQTWRPESFARSVKLVYDASLALYDGAKPDFEAYRATLNASLQVGSVVVGQEVYWMAREASRENARRDRDFRTGATTYRYKFYRPYGDPGPGRVAAIETWKPRARTAVFTWGRESNRRRHPSVRQTLSVPAGALLNISAYRQGDFKQFFADPRTRAEYLKWAPLLLTAEDYLAGKIETESGHNSRGS
jgi:hypothetical protein